MSGNHITQAVAIAGFIHSQTLRRDDASVSHAVRPDDTHVFNAHIAALPIDFKRTWEASTSRRTISTCLRPKALSTTLTLRPADLSPGEYDQFSRLGFVSSFTELGESYKFNEEEKKCWLDLTMATH